MLLLMQYLFAKVFIQLLLNERDIVKWGFEMCTWLAFGLAGDKFLQRADFK